MALSLGERVLLGVHKDLLKVGVNDLAAKLFEPQEELEEVLFH